VPLEELHVQEMWAGGRILDEFKARNTAETSDVKKACYRASGKRCTVGGMYAELQMALAVKCFASDKVSSCM
jgi:hypothetical protein